MQMKFIITGQGKWWSLADFFGIPCFGSFFGCIIRVYFNSWGIVIGVSGLIWVFITGRRGYWKQLVNFVSLFITLFVLSNHFPWYLTYLKHYWITFGRRFESESWLMSISTSSSESFKVISNTGSVKLERCGRMRQYMILAQFIYIMIPRDQTSKRNVIYWIHWSDFFWYKVDQI